MRNLRKWFDRNEDNRVGSVLLCLVFYNFLTVTISPLSLADTSKTNPDLETYPFTDFVDGKTSQKSKVEVLGSNLKRHVARLRKVANKKVELVFLVDSSSSVGAEDFFNELKFVKKLLADFTVSVEATRVAVITFSSKRNVVRHVDHITQPSPDNHKCKLLEDQLAKITYVGGGTYTLGAVLQAQEVLKFARPNSTKAVFLVTDGYSNAGDPRPAAKKLKENGVEIFTFGIRFGNVQELTEMASDPAEEHTYILESFEEFEALARRALHEDLQIGDYLAQPDASCNRLCAKGFACCDQKASCTCGTHTGHYACLCDAGFYGTGLEGDCLACPEGTFKEASDPGDVTSCKRCPNIFHFSPRGSSSSKNCRCKAGYRNPPGADNNSCDVVRCPPLKPPEHGYFVNEDCDTAFNAACGIGCEPGFRLVGNSIRLCTESGTWTGDETKCEMKTCSVLHPPRFGKMECTNEKPMYDVECVFSCLPGYTLVGSLKRTCLPIGLWDGLPVFCRSVACSPLVAPQHGYISPNKCARKKVSYGDVCAYSCEPGYVISGAKQAKCHDGGAWTNKLNKTRCLDKQPPRLTCPKNIVVNAEEAQMYIGAMVRWKLPEVTDNSGEDPSLLVVPAVFPPRVFLIGTNTITYIAEDKNFNKAECSFKITVRDTYPPTIDLCESPPPVFSRIVPVQVTWPDPFFSDNSGDPVNITAPVIPQGGFRYGETKLKYEAKDSSGNINTCVITVTVQEHACTYPPEPVNGLMNCTENATQVSCTLSCLPGFAFVETPKDVYKCAYDGIWHPTDVFPDCSETELSNSVVQIGLVSLATNKSDLGCSDYFLLDQLQKHFKRKIFQRINGICANDVQCSIEKALLTCNQNRERKEEETNRISRKRRTSTFFSKHKRSADDAATISQNIIVEFELAGTVEKSGQEFLLSNVKKVMETLETAAEQGELDMTMGSNFFRIESIHFPGREPKFRCVQGSMPLNNTCVKCPIGTFFSVISEECEACGLGTYQFQEGQVSCLVCPEKTSTTKGQSKSVGECKAQCLPGSYSPTGLEVCQTCTQGFYQPLYAQTFCLECAGATTTWRRGTRHLKDCQEICQPGAVSRTGLRPCFLCPDGYYQPGKGRKVCFRCPNGQPTNKRGAHALTDCKDYNDEASAFSHLEILPVNDCFSVPCLHGSICEAQEFGYVCHCKTGYKGIHCDVDIDECSSQPCFNNATCQDLVNGYKCVCESGFTGPTCQTEIDECMSRPCQKGATCVDKVNGFSCKCLPGYAGTYCELDINDCLSRPCQNGGNCEDKVADYVCHCSGGFAGSNCEMNIDDCASNPCRHNATCVDGIQTFRCDCLPGFEGDLCQNDIDECQSNPCLNRATCHNIVAGFLCQCPPAFSGQLCETEMSSEFLVHFKTAGTLDFIKVDQLRENLDQFTLCLWLNTSDRSNYGTPFSYATDEFDNALTLTDYSGFVLYINTKRVVSDVTANDGQWRHICVVWKSRDGSWSIYRDGHESDKGIDLATGSTISKEGTLVLGQEQDRRGSSFSVQESFIGTLSLINLWSRTLSTEEISRMVTHCDKYSGDVLAWPDFQPGFRGQLVAETSKFCHECDKDLSIENGTVVVSGNKPGGNASYVCDAGFELMGMAKRVCTIFGSWSGNSPKCSRVTCGYPPSLKNGKYSGWKYQYKDNVEYSCFPGYRLIGTAIRSCEADKTWSNDQPVCEEILCGPVSTPNNSKITDDSQGGKYKPGNKLVISCQEGYRLDGLETITCLETGIWSDHTPICQPKSCQMPPTVPNSSVLGKKRNFKVGDWVRYGCNVGYQLQGNDTIKCGIKSQWVGEVPKCERKPCGLPPKAPNSVVTENILYFGDLANYHCVLGYELTEGVTQLECLENQTWGGRLLKCSPVNCPSLVPPLHGVFNPANSRSLNAVVSYSCIPGYQLGGVKTRKCLSNAEWSGDEPKCHPVLCGPPKPIPNGRFIGDDFSVGNTVMYSCNTGYKILGKAAITCGKNGLWTLDAPICEPVRCLEPRNQNNGVVLFSASFFGQRAEYRCLNGYELVGAASSVCRENGKWDPLPPTCRPVSCGPPPKIESAEFNTTGTEFGSSAQYVCQIGFRVKSLSEAVLFCLENGTWSQPYPHCDIVRCSVPLPIGNGNPVYSDNSFASTVEYYCDKGYRLEGLVQRMCQADGKWSGEKPRCERIQCPVLSKPSNGKLVTNDLYYAHDAIYSCEIGHEIYEPNVKTVRIGEVYRRVCQEDGLWSGNQPECRPVNCDSDVLRLENGRVSGTTFSFDSILQYTCDTGYKLLGTKTRKCGADKRWNSEPPFCQVIQCPEPESLPNGNLLSSLSRNFGENLEYSCDKGHRLVGAKALMCTNNGKWNHPIPECVKINCSQPNTIEHGLAYIKSLSYGSYVRYQCNRGYDLHGPEERQCDENGQWSLEEPFCRRILCQKPPKIANAKVSNIIFYSGNVMKIECQRGYKIVPDNATLKCDDNGKWRGEFPMCDRIECPEPKELKFGGFQRGEYTFESKVIYHCNDGWDLLGEETLTCGSDGKWSVEAPICVGTKCPALVKVESSVSNSTETKYGTVVFFECLPGYVLRGIQKITCQIHNKWSDSAPRCDPVNCTRVVNVSNGKCLGDSVKFGSKLSCVCDDGYQLHGQNVLTCIESGQWSGEDPICVPVSCPIPDSMYNGQVYLIRITEANDINKSIIHPASVSISKKVSSRSLVANVGFRRGDIKVDGKFILTESRNEAFLYKDELTYECDEGYDLIGVSLRVCNQNGRWSNEDPVCELVLCDSPSTPSNGYVTFQAPPVFGSEANYQCDTGYEPLGQTNRRCLSNGTWSGISPICSVIKCETPPIVTNGTVKISSLSYGSVAFYGCEEGYKLEGEPLRTCESNKTWTGRDPQCRIVECPEISATRYGVITLEKRTVQSRVRLTCDTGYEIPPGSSNIVQCLLNGIWSGSFEDCVLVTCPKISTLRNGSVIIYNDTSSYNSALGFKCNLGFVLVGSENRICQANKTWSGSETICQPVTCRLLTIPSHGGLTVTGITYNSEAKFICNEGYNLIGSKSARCLSNSQWSKATPKCQIKTCPNLDDIENGFVYGNSKVYKSSISFACQPKYRLIGPKKIECLLKEQWSGPIPTCQRHLCEELPQIENSEILNTLSGTLEINSTQEVRCKSGFRVEGNGTFNCDHRGNWKTRGIQPRCTLITCKKTNLILNGFHNGSDDNGIVFVPGSLIEFECDPGYVLKGRNRSTCQLNGRWFPETPICQKICNESPVIANGQGYVEEHNDGTSELIYTCDHGYKLMGNDRDICDKYKPYWLLNGTWCERIVCGQLISVPQATIALTDSFVGSLATYRCDKGYHLIGNSSLICTNNGEWMGRVPKCEPLLCVPPKAPENGFVVLKEHPVLTITLKYTAEMATFHCAVGYILIGNKIMKCKNGVWLGNLPSCEAISCGKPNLYPRATTFTGSSYDYGKNVRVQCPHGTILNGNATIVCLANGSWSQQPKCEDSCSSPCKDGHVCLRGSCQCPHGFSGQDCSHPICILPCLYGGWCKAPYQCQCKHGYKGERCQIRVKRIILRTVSLGSNIANNN